MTSSIIFNIFFPTLVKAKCLSLIPVPELDRRAKETAENFAEGEEVPLRELLFLELLRWFKSDFFTWVNAPSCTFCGVMKEREEKSEHSITLLFFSYIISS